MLSRSIRRVCEVRRAAQFMSMNSPDHIASVGSDNAEERVAVLLEELTRERLLVKTLREENETLRGNVQLLSQREAELVDLNKTIQEQQRSSDVYSSRMAEQEIKFNNLRVDFEDYKKLVEVEKLKLNQARALPLILSGVGGALVVYLIVRADMKLEQENAKHLKFELNQMWRGRVREVQSALDEVRVENEKLTKSLSDLKKSKPAQGWLSVGGLRII